MASVDASSVMSASARMCYELASVLFVEAGKDVNNYVRMDDTAWCFWSLVKTMYATHKRPRFQEFLPSKCASFLTVRLPRPPSRCCYPHQPHRVQLTARSAAPPRCQPSVCGNRPPPPTPRRRRAPRVCPRAPRLATPPTAPRTARVQRPTLRSIA